MQRKLVCRLRGRNPRDARYQAQIGGLLDRKAAVCLKLRYSLVVCFTDPLGSCFYEFVHEPGGERTGRDSVHIGEFPAFMS